MILRVEHIGIAIKSLGLSDDVFARLLGTSAFKHEPVEREKVTTSFFKTGETKIELLQSGPGGTIAGFIERKGEGLHHIAFETDDIEAEMKRLRDSGFTLINDRPVPGADNKLVFFVHPRSCNGVLVEFCQEIK